MATPEEWSEQLAATGSVEIRASRLKVFASLLGALALTALSVLLIRADNVALVVVGWVALALFGLLSIPVLIHKLVVARVELRVTPEGVQTVQTGDTVIAWSAIEVVKLSRVHRTSFISLVIPEPAYGELMNTTPKRVKGAGDRAVIGEKAIGLPGGLTGKLADLAEWLETERIVRSDRLDSRSSN